jgi:UDP-3-O-[3-hydroxymyristoyl] glucosamine N-acyltransferase
MEPLDMIAVREIIEFLDSEVIQVFGNTEKVYVKHLKPAESVDKDTLDWINPARIGKQEIVENSKAKVILVDKDVKYSSNIQSQNKTLILVNNPKLCLVKIGHKFFVENLTPGIHQTATIHSLAKLGENVHVGANCSIGNCTIGNHVIIYPNVVINDKVKIGDHVTIKAGAVLGFDGFGYERDGSNNLIKFPQLGNLIIHDHVDIGSNTCIDRGSLSDTVIGFNTKINNLCHIAHNVVIGKNVVITAHVAISGSTIIGDNVWISPNVSLRGHQKIGQGATIGMGAVVTKDIPSGETWLGNPAIRFEK